MQIISWESLLTLGWICHFAGTYDYRLQSLSTCGACTKWRHDVLWILNHRRGLPSSTEHYNAKKVGFRGQKVFSFNCAYKETADHSNAVDRSPIHVTSCRNVTVLFQSVQRASNVSCFRDPTVFLLSIDRWQKILQMLSRLPKEGVWKALVSIMFYISFVVDAIPCGCQQCNIINCPCPATGTPIMIPASPFMKKLGCGTGVSVYLMERYNYEVYVHILYAIWAVLKH